MKKLGNTEYVQLLLHPTERKMAIRPCLKMDVHSIKWRPDPDKDFIPKTISCPHFSSALYKIMDWNPDYAYRIRGTWAKRGVDEIIVFSLQNAEPVAFIEAAEKLPDSKRRRRVTLTPEEWNDSFGEDFYEYALDNSFYYLAPKTNWSAILPNDIILCLIEAITIYDTHIEMKMRQDFTSIFSTEQTTVS